MKNDYFKISLDIGSYIYIYIYILFMQVGFVLARSGIWLAQLGLDHKFIGLKRIVILIIL